MNGTPSARRASDEELKQVTAEEVAARKEEKLNTPLVAPELRLPAEGGVFLLEEVAGKPVLHKMEGSKVQVDDDIGKEYAETLGQPDFEPDADD